MKIVITLIALLCGIEAFGYNIDVIQTVAHPALDNTYKGIIDKLASENIKPNIKFANAQGDLVLSNQIAQKFISEKPDAIISIATLASQSVVNANRNSDIPVIFSSVTDPKEAGLLKDNAEVTGVSNFIPLDEQLKLFKEILPNLTRLGIIYNPGEVNSIKILAHLKEIAVQYNIEIIAATASKTTEVSSSINKLIGNVDAVFISNDNTALSAFGTIARISLENEIPVFVSDTDMVEYGALAALGPNQYELGKQTAEIVMRVLKGEKAKTIAVEYPKTIELVINEKISEKLGVKFSKEILDRAKKL